MLDCFDAQLVSLLLVENWKNLIWIYEQK
jgi:hypothetical protein